MNRYKLLLIISILALVPMLMLGNSIQTRAAEKEALSTRPVVAEEGIEPRSELWAKDYPRQYDSWKKTRKSDEITDMLEEKPQLSVLWAGYGFAKDYNAPRGHGNAVKSNQNSLRTGAPFDPKSGPMPTACWTCKSPDVLGIMKDEGDLEYYTGKWAKYGDKIANSIGCADCHDSQTAELKVGREYLWKGLEAAGVKKEDVTHQDMRSLVCAQCHSEYYFKKTPWTDDKGVEKTAKVVTLPWAEGLSAEDMERYYDAIEFKDWTHKISKAPMLKAQHPGYEIFKTGIHGQKGVSCADCHMPYTQEGSVKYSDHHVQSPLENIQNSCLQCHREGEKKLKSIVATKLIRKEQLMELAMDSLAKAHLEAGKAWELGAKPEEMNEILTDIRHAQWRWDYSIASHGSFFHAPEETLRLLGVASEKAQGARIKLVKVLAKYGAVDFVAPNFSTKENAQALAGVNLEKLVAEKESFRATLLAEWDKQQLANNRRTKNAQDGMTDNTSYTNKN